MCWYIFATLRDQQPLKIIKVRVSPKAVFRCSYRPSMFQNTSPFLLHPNEAGSQGPALVIENTEVGTRETHISGSPALICHQSSFSVQSMEIRQG